MSEILQLIPEQQTALDIGEYRVRVTQSLTLQGSIKPQIVEERTLLVAGPRFLLKPDAVVSVFPPPGSRGDFNSFLPYLVLRRATLPWERRIAGNAAPEPPFLALLIFNLSEVAAEESTSAIVEPKSMTIGALLSARGLTAERSDPVESTVTALAMDAGFLASILPRSDELALLTHIRQRQGAEREAVVICNRRPLPETSYVAHLVSLEGLDPDHLPSSGEVMLPSLHTWRFTSGQDRIGLVERLEELHCDSLSLPEHTAALGAYAALRREGYAAMPYGLAWGDRGYGLYRGPFVPFPVSEPVDTSVRQARSRNSGDGLVTYFTDLGLPDLSLAAAWELGRMLMLRQREAAMRYHRFRRQQAGLAYRLSTTDEDYHLVVSDQLPQTTHVLPEDVAEFCAELARLEGIPFGYLVPDTRMIPDKSLRVFHVDPRWICCLLAGALSIGRSNRRDLVSEEQYLRHQMDAVPTRSGVLLRSPVVTERPWQDYTLTDAAGQILRVVRRQLLAADLLLILVDGVVHRIEAQESPKSAHFGLKEGVEDGQEVFSKDAKDPVTLAEVSDGTVTLGDDHYRYGDREVLDIRRLAQDLHAVHAQILEKSHHFALQLLESGARGMTITVGASS